jgi:8-oxo-dGTP diphosphatase
MEEKGYLNIGGLLLIRTAGKAILIHENKLLTIKYQDDQGVFYSLPGGGQEYGETLPVNVRRECIEELGIDVNVGDLIFIREVIIEAKRIHQVEFIFLCLSNSIESAGIGNVPDSGQLGIEWLPLKHLLDYRVFPLEARNYLKDLSVCKTSYPIFIESI